MSTRYQPPHHSRGKLAKVPGNSREFQGPQVAFSKNSKLKEGNFFKQVVSFNDTPFIPHLKNNSGSKTPSTASCQSQSSCVFMNNNKARIPQKQILQFGPSKSALLQRKSKNKNFDISESSGFTSHSERLAINKIKPQNTLNSMSNRSLFNINEDLRKSANKITTTVTVHLSDNGRAHSTPDLLGSPKGREHISHFQQGKPQIKTPSISNKEKVLPWMSYISNQDRSKSAVNIAPEIISVKERKDMSKSINELSSRHMECRNSRENFELNSLQVFRQHKYKDRNKAEKRFQQLEHLDKNECCNEIVHQLRSGFLPHTYENIEKLRFIDYLNEDFIISSKIKKDNLLKSKFPSSLKKKINSEPIYTEIHDNKLNNFIDKTESKPPTPFVKKKVTFSTFHQPILESDEIFWNKKIIPGTFLGICEIKEPMRSKSDSFRRRIATLCYRQILAGNKKCTYEFMDKLDISRKGEEMYIILNEFRSFDIRDKNGLIMAKHKFSDISVINYIEEDPNAFVYIGRCKFNGRIGVAIRLTKIKYLSLIISSFQQRR